MPQRLLTVISLFTLWISAFAIEVEIQNAWLDLNAKNNIGNNIISAHCKLEINGLKNTSIDLVAIVMDDEGEWHHDSQGNIVKTHYSLTPSYDSTVWSDVEVWLKQDKLSPKPGKHNYEVYLYIYYDGKWYGRTKAGSYTMTGSSASNLHANNSTQYINCSYCNATGKINCRFCNGTGYVSMPKYFPYPPYSLYYEKATCPTCGGKSHTKCGFCDGTGRIKVNNSSNSSSSSFNYTPNNSGSTYTPNHNSNSSENSKRTTCRICGGTGVCTSCHGKGGEWRNTGYYTGANSKSWIDCPSCRGNKKCFNCYGKGYQ